MFTAEAENVLSVTLFVLAFIVVLVGVLLIILSALTRAGEEGRGERRVEGGGVIIVGPLPIVIGTSQSVARVLVILALVLFLVVVVAFALLTRWFP